MSHARDFKLGPALIRPAERSITTSEGTSRVDFKAMQVLTCLTRKAGEEVTKDEIFDAVWPDQAISEEVLPVAVRTLRRALGDDARSPTYIETLPKIGYRLIAPVEPDQPEERAGAPRRRMALLIGALASMAVVVLGVWPGPRWFSAPKAEAIAVLPFQNLTGDATQDYLASGMAETLSTELARYRELRVLAPPSSRLSEVADEDPAAIARELGAELVLTGSVQRSGDRLRVSVRLVEGATGEQHWASSVDGLLNELFEIQERLFSDTASQIGRDLPETFRKTTDDEAFRAYLRARFLSHEQSPESLESAQRELRRAVDLDRDFAEAWADLGLAEMTRWEMGLVDGPEARTTALEAAEKALRVDPNLARAHRLRGLVAFLIDWDFETAGVAFERARSFDPSDPLARDWSARYLASQLRFDEALEQMRALTELDPLVYYRDWEAYLLNLAGRHEEALFRIEEQKRVAPDSLELQRQLVATYLWLDRPEDVIREYRHALRIGGAPADLLALFDQQAAEGGLDAVLQFHLQTLGLGEGTEVQRAEVLALMGERSAVIHLLRKAYLQRQQPLLYVVSEPAFRGLLDDPLFREIVGDVGLPLPDDS